MKRNPACDELARLMYLPVPDSRPQSRPDYGTGRSKSRRDLEEQAECNGIFRADFNSKYLLSLVRNIKLSNDLVNNTPLQNVLMAVTAGESPSDSSPSLGRLIRNHADLISRLRLAHVSEFEARYKLMESSNRPDSLNKEVASIVRTISHLYATIFCNAPDGTVLPPFPPKIRVLCGRLVNQLKGDRLLRAEWTDPNDIPFYISAFQDFATERQSIQTGKRARTITTPWWTCQRRVQVKEDGQGNVPGECATFDGEILLDTCSRCLSVRYCSAEHQREDWPRHKFVCFEQSW